MLGNETEALKFAEQQLSELSEALKNEKAEATGKKPNEQAATKPQQENPPTKANNQTPKIYQPKPRRPEGKSAELPNEQAGQPNQTKPARSTHQPNQPTPPNSQAQQAGQQPQTGPASFLEKGFNRSERGQNPITGGHHREWTDRLRDVEEAVDRPEVREQVARIREDIRKLNTEFRRNSKEPEWDLVEKKILNRLMKSAAPSPKNWPSPSPTVLSCRSTATPCPVASVIWWKNITSDWAKANNRRPPPR